MATAKKPTLDPAEVAEKGLYEAAESGDNSLEVSDGNYLGTAQEYRNHAEDVHAPAPFEREDEVAVADAVKEAAEANSANVGFQGFSTDVAHPSEKKTAADKAADRQRLIAEAQEAEAKSILGKDDDEKAPPPAPSV